MLTKVGNVGRLLNKNELARYLLGGFLDRPQRNWYKSQSVAHANPMKHESQGISCAGTVLKTLASNNKERGSFRE